MQRSSTTTTAAAASLSDVVLVATMMIICDVKALSFFLGAMMLCVFGIYGICRVDDIRRKK